MPFVFDKIKQHSFHYVPLQLGIESTDVDHKIKILKALILFWYDCRGKLWFKWKNNTYRKVSLHSSSHHNQLNLCNANKFI